MGYAADVTGTIKIELSNPKYWVEVKSCLTRKDQRQVEAALTSVTYNDAGGIKGSPDVSKSRDLLVQLSIVDWNLTDDADERLPINPGTIGGVLSGKDFDLLWKRLNAMNKMPTSDEVATFPGEGERGDRPEGASAGQPA